MASAVTNEPVTAAGTMEGRRAVSSALEVR